MGGAGGFGQQFIPKLPQAISDADSETEQIEKEREVSEFFASVLSEINWKDIDAIQTHREEIITRLEKDYEESIQIIHGGSYSRKTYVNGLSDIDILVKLSDITDISEISSLSSNKILKEVADALKQRYPGTDISVGKMAVTLTFSDGVEIQLLPSFKSGNDYFIPNPENTGWIKSNPKLFSERLTAINEICDRKLVPTIKLLKQICSSNDVEISSYHIENLAVNIFENYRGVKKYPQMVDHFFAQAKIKIFTPTKDVTGQNFYVDSDISYQTRMSLSTVFESIENEIREANNKSSISLWKEIVK